MNTRTVTSVTGLILTSAFLSALAANNAVAETYKVDPVHSSAIFRIKHMNVSYFWGRFDDVSGTVAWDAAKPEESSFDVQIKTESVNTNNPKRDNHLKSPDFFNAKQFPAMSFKSKSVKKTGDDTFDVSGDFTLHGVTKPITVKIEHTGDGKGKDGDSLVGFESTFNIKRSDFDMKFADGALGDDIRIIVSIEAGRK